MFGEKPEDLVLSSGLGREGDALSHQIGNRSDPRVFAQDVGVEDRDHPRPRAHSGVRLDGRQLDPPLLQQPHVLARARGLDHLHDQSRIMALGHLADGIGEGIRFALVGTRGDGQSL